MIALPRPPKGAFCCFAGIYFLVVWAEYVSPGYLKTYNIAERGEPIPTGFLAPESKLATMGREVLSNYYFFRPGYTIEIRFAPLKFTFVEESDSVLEKLRMIFGFETKIEEHTYISRIAHFPFSPQDVATYGNSTAVFVIRPDNDLARTKTGSPLITFKDTIAKIGGVVSFASTCLVLLFGVSAVSPWGIIARVPYFRRKITKNLARDYDQRNGMSRGPFTGFSSEQTNKEIDFDEVSPSGLPVRGDKGQSQQQQQSNTFGANIRVGEFEPEIECQDADTKIRYLKERLDELEIVLSDYYLDTEVFQTFATAQTEVTAAAHPVRTAGGMASRLALNRTKKSDKDGDAAGAVVSNTTAPAATAATAAAGSSPSASFHASEKTEVSGGSALQGILVD
ncbi:hypothetical protein BGZ73_006788 [Actinomortierella ambigua]|nr:hypothetical protein BGZ73_006788 [Actinomortierella ambigua]